MTVRELNREQLIELKGRYIDDRNAEKGEGTSYQEYAEADYLVSDEEIFTAYDGTEFVEDDFLS